MAGVNKCIFIGNLGADPEVRYTQGGACVANMRMAVTTRYKSGDEWKDDTQWINIVVWGKQAESAGKYLAKGRPVYVEGRLRNRSWDDKDGNKRWTTEVVAQSIQYLGSQKGEGSGGEERREAEKAAPKGGKSDDEFGGEFSDTGIDDDDDIPF